MMHCEEIHKCAAAVCRGVAVRSRELVYSSNRDVELIDVTADVERVVAESGIESGICVVSVPHATAAVIEN
ncbi:MAG: YjbQ family protein, partial [Nitrososphaeria archaeon]